MRSREKPVYDVLRGYQVMVAIKLGVDSYREGKAWPSTRAAAGYSSKVAGAQGIPAAGSLLRK